MTITLTARVEVTDDVTVHMASGPCETWAEAADWLATVTRAAESTDFAGYAGWGPLGPA
jgi:hypothetical protein